MKTLTILDLILGVALLFLYQYLVFAFPCLDNDHNSSSLLCSSHRHSEVMSNPAFSYYSGNKVLHFYRWNSPPGVMKIMCIIIIIMCVAVFACVASTLAWDYEMSLMGGGTGLVPGSYGSGYGTGYGGAYGGSYGGSYGGAYGGSYSGYGGTQMDPRSGKGFIIAISAITFIAVLIIFIMVVSRQGTARSSKFYLASIIICAILAFLMIIATIVYLVAINPTAQSTGSMYYNQVVQMCAQFQNQVQPQGLFLNQYLYHYCVVEPQEVRHFFSNNVWLDLWHRMCGFCVVPFSVYTESLFSFSQRGSSKLNSQLMDTWRWNYDFKRLEEKCNRTEWCQEEKSLQMFILLELYVFVYFKVIKSKRNKNLTNVCAPLSVLNQLVLGALRDWCNWAPNFSHFLNRGKYWTPVFVCLIFLKLTSLNVTCKNCKHHHNPDRNGVTDCRLWAGDILSSRIHVGDQELGVFLHIFALKQQSAELSKCAVGNQLVHVVILGTQFVLHEFGIIVSWQTCTCKCPLAKSLFGGRCYKIEIFREMWETCLSFTSLIMGIT